MKPHMFKTAIGFDDINILPNFSNIKSRKDIDTSSVIARDNTTSPTVSELMKLKYPIILSPMDTVSSVESCVAMNSIGAASILHRFMSLEDRLSQAKEIKNKSGKSFVAIGLNDMDHLESFVDFTDLFFLDVAHGTTEQVFDFIRGYIACFQWTNIPIITGNTLTMSSVSKHFDLGSDGVRHGIGGGCFVPYMKVITSSGSKNICDVKVGDYVYTHTGNLNKVINTIKRNETKRLLKINDIVCTDNHEFYVIRKDKLKNCTTEKDVEKFAEWVQAKHLTKDFKLLKVIGKYEIVDIENIEEYSYLGEVYDLTVENDHSYNVEGVAVHNSVCLTTEMTGVGCPFLTSNYYAWKARREWSQRTGLLRAPTILQDGGIRKPADLVKAIASGCDAVIVGGLFAGCKESPGEIVSENGDFPYKRYRGMASAGVQDDNELYDSKENRFVEGDEVLVPYDPDKSVVDVVYKLNNGLRSAMSYLGFTKLSELKGSLWEDRVTAIRVSPNSTYEGTAHKKIQ